MAKLAADIVGIIVTAVRRPGGAVLVHADKGGISTKSLRGELECLQDFKKRVDDILEDLDGSKASQSVY